MNLRTEQRNSPQQQGPQGLQWLWKLAYEHGFWGGFLTAFALTPLLMVLISFAWTGRIPPWEEQYKSFIIGDTLLAVICGLLAKLAALPTERNFHPTPKYWNKWLLVGLVAAAIFAATQFLTEKLTHWWMLLPPHIFYHHIVLITVLTTLLGGMAYTQYRKKPHNRLWILIGLLFISYIALVTYDNVQPPVPNPPAKANSAETWFFQTIQ